ncbi:MAG: BamA/TamA family outer membrane protein [Gemmatimonadota bacterium]|nr:BamA/TamA family outer membrane protein [Gemmatimonadota bacterium]
MRRRRGSAFGLGARPTRVFFLAGIAHAAWAATPGPAQDLGEPEVVEIAFQGVERFSDAELAKAILTQVTSCRTFAFVFPLPICPLTDWGFAHSRKYLSEPELPLDLLRLQLFYRQRGYREATVDTVVTRENGKARISFVVAEGDPTLIREFTVLGAEGILDEKRQAELLAIGAGDPLDLSNLARGEGRLTEALRALGYVNATVLRDYFVPRGSRAAEVTLRIDTGPRVRIGEIRIEGAGDVGDEIIRSLLSFESGDIFRDGEIIQSQRRLYNLEAIRFATVTSERRSDTDTLIDLRIQVAAAPKRTVGIGFGMETDECGQLQARLTNRNFLGQGRVLRLTTRLSNLFAGQLEGSFPCTDVSPDGIFQELNFRAEAAFEQPVFRGGKNSLRTTVYAEKETVPDLFVRTSAGGELAFTHRFSPSMSLTASVSPELTSFGVQSADIYFCVNFGFCDPEDIGVLSEQRWLSPLGLLWALDRTDDRFSPSRGFYVATGLEHAGLVTGSDYRYLRATLSGAAFKRLTNSTVLAGHIRFGSIDALPSQTFEAGTTDEIIHPRKRFFAGGAESVRGFGANLLGPTVLVVDANADCPDLDLNACVEGLSARAFDQRPAGGNAVLEASLELRTAIGDRWTFVSFVDVGQVWQSLGIRTKVVATPGVGVRFRSPIGPLRLDLGYDPSGPADRPVVAVLEGGDIQELNRTIRFDPFTDDDPGVLLEIARRLQLQVSIGEAF